jgi:nucleotide-binding universal stress UspA family protein
MPIAMKKILCTTDFSKAATNAVDYAALIAEKVGASLTLLHVLHLPMLDTTETALVAGEVLEEQKEHAINKMRALIHYLSQKYADKHLQVDYLVREDLLADCVQHLTKTAGYDLVVIGSTGGGNTLEEILIGSNTESVIESVKCPVLTVPIKTIPANFKHIVYASDYQPEDIAALREVLQFAQLFGAAVEVVHVSEKASSASDSKANQFRNKLRQALPEYELEFHEVIHKDEVVGMKDYLTRKNADLLAIMKKRKSFFSHIFSQSFSEQLTYQSKLPMLIIHE